MAAQLSHSMRQNYETLTVDGYYSLVSESYRNPHFSGLVKVLHLCLDRLWAYELRNEPETRAERPLRCLDLAAGSGEATESTRWPSPTAPVSLRPSPRTPSQPTLPRPSLDLIATDPFTSPAFTKRFPSLRCLPHSFRDIASPTSALHDLDPFDIVVISFALHLAGEKGELWALLTALSERCRWLVVLAPHKKPEIKNGWGWTRCDPQTCEPASEGKQGGEAGDGREIVLDRVRLRLYRSTFTSNDEQE